MRQTVNTLDIMNNLPCMIFQGCGNPDDFVLSFVSEGCSELTGYKSADLLSGGMKLTDIIHHNDKAAFIKLAEATLAVGVPLEKTFRIQTKDGTEKWCFLSCHVTDTNSEGMPGVFEGFIVNISKQFHIETSLQANNEKFEFLSKMNHEIRTPMNAILGMAELGLKEDMPDSVREYTHIIKQAGGKLIAVMNDVLDYKKLENNKLVIYPEVYALSSLIHDVVNNAKVWVDNTALDFYVNIDSRLPELLVGDKFRIQQILMNLILNSVKFTEKGYLFLIIEGEMLENNINLSLTVSDTGRGMKEEDLSEIFNKYTQFDIKNIEGIGLGLSVTHGLIKLMSGDISVSSIYGVGSIFKVELPQGVHSPEAVCSVDSPESKRVLIYEKDEESSDLIAGILNNLSVEYGTVDNITDCYAALLRNEYSFVFADEALYGELLKLYPKLNTNTKTVLITYGKNVTAASADYILTRPVYCIPVADVLNGYNQDERYDTVKAGFSGFTASEARVLIVDDISSNLMVAKGLLSPYQMHLDFCESGAEAINAVKLKHYDLIFMDYMMPVLDGAETVACIRMLEDCGTDCKNVPIVVLTANIANITRETFRDSGFDDFLSKPIDVNELNAIIKKWIPKEKQIKSQNTIIEDKAEIKPKLRIKDINISTGIARTGGSFDFYVRVLEKFFENGNKLIGELDLCLEKGNTGMYCIHVHAIKSAAAGIGAERVSAVAWELELAAGRGDLIFVRENHSAFSNSLKILLSDINSALKINPSVSFNYEPEKPAIADAPPKVLIIDDTEMYHYTITSQLKDACEISSAFSGKEGLEKAAEIKPDLIMLDVYMPGMSGYDVLIKLKEDDILKKIPVILITGNESEEDIAKGYALGAVDYIVKPFNYNKLGTKVKNVLIGIS